MNVDDFLEHHGVRGMKWGVRKKRETGDGNSDVQRLLKENPAPKLSPEQNRKLQENKAKFDAKFQSDEASGDVKKGHWSPTPKQKILIATGAAAVAGILIATAAKKAGVNAELKKSFSVEDYMKVAREVESPGWMHNLSGSKMSGKDFAGLVEHTQGRIWSSSGYVTKESFLQKETTLPAGHQFYRLSHAAETSFSGHTYATASHEDLTRYMSTFGGSNLIQFKTKGEFKIPDLHTRLEAMRKAMIYDGYESKSLTPEKVLTAYNDRAGGGWSDGRSIKFFHILKEQGYHAIVDDMDAGVYGEMPLVIFNHESLTSKTSEHLTLDQKMAMAKEVVELSNRR